MVQETKASRRTSQSTNASLQEDEDLDCRQCYDATIVDVNFRTAKDDTPATRIESHSVFELLKDGSSIIAGDQDQQLRWIHLPANNMAWVEDLFDRLRERQIDPKPKPGDGDGDDISAGVKLDGVLRNSLWRHAYRGKKSSAVHARFMAPLAARYSSSEDDDPESDDSDLKWEDANTVAMYMPYLHWENYDSWKDRQKHIARMKTLEYATPGARCDCAYDFVGSVDEQAKRKESALLHQSLFHASPLHDRRTLDQSYFYNVRNIARRDEDQVIGTYTDSPTGMDGKPRKMMMTDQLWMWIVEDKTLVTAFPSTKALGLKGGDVASKLFEELPQAVKQGTVKSSHGLIALIIDHCTGVFHRNDIHEDLAFFQFFADEIGVVKNELQDMLRRFYVLSGLIEALWTKPGVTVEHMSSQLDVLLSIKQEIRLIARVDKIRSDLDKIDFICSQQESTSRDLVKCYKSSRSLTATLETLKSRRKSWADMAMKLKETRGSLQNLLDLKQRQATVGEARSVRYQIELAAKQGQSIMLLTVITVIFLPVSMLATVFGMNAKELVGRDGGKISLKKITAVVVPATLTLITCTLALVFFKEAKDMVVGLWSRVRERLTRFEDEEVVKHASLVGAKV